ncbi:FlgO family outer membrane protein [Arsukibacterium sp.]|uniref:FlgO family outer membrane protein n=1 Tax=Arsukibacterium sp. TaxID=1977258 RepID=UPI00299ECE32|nr:FlgO family outer membrane protein [Arsukibacterium sp.]MDX1677662.1 FlgO family outer membrane protein [Arsukibacterium sp.]
MNWLGLVTVGLLTGTVLLGCAGRMAPEQLPVAASELSPQPLGFYTERLARQLFAQLDDSPLWLARPQIAVSSFLPATALNLRDANTEQRDFANQLSESMLGHSRQFGYAVYEYRLSNEVMLADNYEQALSRQLADINRKGEANTLLTGTYTQQQDAVIVNARLIHIPSKQVLAAVTDYIPANVLWSTQQINKRGAMFYRQGPAGENK